MTVKLRVSEIIRPIQAESPDDRGCFVFSVLPRRWRNETP